MAEVAARRNVVVIVRTHNPAVGRLIDLLGLRDVQAESSR
jgi:hypothetical protein